MDATRLFIHRRILFLAYDVIASSTILASLLQCIGQNFCMNFYSNCRVLVYYIEGHLFFVSIIGCHNCSYSAILNSYLYLLIQLLTLSFSLSPSRALCYRIKKSWYS